MADLRILVIDDNKNWQRALPKILRRLQKKVSVDVAANYDEALKNIQSTAYDLATVDLSLLGDSRLVPHESDLQGLELLRVFHHTPHNQNCALIVLTGYPTADYTRQALRTYKDVDFLDKDEFDNQHFLDVARKAIKKARLRKTR